MPRIDTYISDPMGYLEEVVQEKGTTTAYYALERSHLMFDRPSTSRRAKPADLFAGSTARVVRSVRRENTGSQRTTTLGYRQPNGFLPLTNYWIRVLPVFNGPAGGTYGPYEPLSVSTWNEATRKALQEIKSQKVNLTVSVPELGKTTDMVANLARSVYSALRSLRKGEFRQLARAFRQPTVSLDKDLASKWLQLQYGWKPLMSDIYGLSEEIDRKVHDVGVLVYGSATHKMSYTFSQKEFPSASGGPFTGSARLRYKTRYRYRVDSATAARLKHIGLSNPALTVWELIPYSFVVDWIYDIGGYLETLDATVGLKDLLCVQSVRYDASAEFPKIPYNRGYNTMYPRWQASGRTVWSASIRGAPGGFPSPPRPTLKIPQSTNRMINAVALLRNFLK